MAQILGVEEAVARGVAGTEPERARRQAERERGREAERAGLERVNGREHRADDDRRAGGEQGHRRQVAGAAEQEQDPVGHRLADLAAGPVEVEDAREEGRQGDQSQADHVPLVLLEMR